MLVINEAYKCASATSEQSSKFSFNFIFSGIPPWTGNVVIRFTRRCCTECCRVIGVRQEGMYCEALSRRYIVFFT